MKALAILVAATSLLLSGCATTLHSNVTVFHEWPGDLQDKSYTFETPAPGDDTLEYRSYQNLVSGELAKLGFTQAASTKDANLRVGMQFSTIDHPVKVLTATDPWMYGPGPWGYGPRWGYPYRHRYYGYYGFYRPYYDPWMWGPMEYRETIQHNYDRNLRVTINNLQGKKLYDVTVQNTSRKQSTPMVMPALYRLPGRERQGQARRP
jgi:hypothetical protein